MRRLIGILVSVVALLVLVPAIHAQDQMVPAGTHTAKHVQLSPARKRDATGGGEECEYCKPRRRNHASHWTAAQQWAERKIDDTGDKVEPDL